MTNSEKRIVPIAELYPLECAAVHYRYDKSALLCKQIKSGEKVLDDLTPPVVCDVDGRLLVKDGCNRVYAAKQAGIESVPIVMYGSIVDPGMELYHRDTIMLRDKKSQKGFENYSIAPDETTRTEWTLEEQREIRQLKLDAGLE